MPMLSMRCLSAQSRIAMAIDLPVWLSVKLNLELRVRRLNRVPINAVVKHSGATPSCVLVSLVHLQLQVHVARSLSGVNREGLCPHII